MQTRLRKLKDVKLEKPILIEGLPGVGMVGKLCVDQLIEQLKPEKFIEITSPHFKPQVDINKDSVVQLRKNYLYAHKTKKGKSDLVFLGGREQGVTPQGQHELSQKVIETMKELDVHFIYTLGGYGVGKLKEEPNVLGAVTHKEVKKKYKKLVKFSRGGAIAGAAGLLLGIGKEEGIKGICLMGETHGQVLDPNSAKFVLKVLEEKLGIKIDYSELEDKKNEVKEAIEKMKQTHGPSPGNPRIPGTNATKSPLDYIQ